MLVEFIKMGLNKVLSAKVRWRPDLYQYLLGACTRGDCVLTNIEVVRSNAACSVLGLVRLAQLGT